MRAQRAAVMRASACAALLLWLLSACQAPLFARADETLVERDRRLIENAIAAMPAQRPGMPDLYVLGIAGDGHENVFRNEALYLEQLTAGRFGAQGRSLLLVNHTDSLGPAPRPLATLGNLRLALRGIGAAMDRDDDLLLLFATSHGTEDHAFVLQLWPVLDAALRPQELRQALDESGIRYRIVVVSACYSGGFLAALRAPDTLAITAARHDRPSFGCGSASNLTYFGRAWLVDGLNRSQSFIAAYDHATADIARRERADAFAPSLPQIDVGPAILPRLHAWQATLSPAPAVPYPFPDDATSKAKAAAP